MDSRKWIAIVLAFLVAACSKLPAMVFRKLRVAGYVLILLSLFLLSAIFINAIYSSGSLHIALRPLGLSSGMAALISLVPLILAIRVLTYTIRVSDDELVISDLITKSVPLRDISEVKIGTSRASTFCQIRLLTGKEDLQVTSDLETFPEFVSLLWNSVDESKSGGSRSS